LGIAWFKIKNEGCVKSDMFAIARKLVCGKELAVKYMCS
jgi:hypothetical protein